MWFLFVILPCRFLAHCAAMTRDQARQSVRSPRKTCCRIAWLLLILPWQTGFCVARFLIGLVWRFVTSRAPCITSPEPKKAIQQCVEDPPVRPRFPLPVVFESDPTPERLLRFRFVVDELRRREYEPRFVTSLPNEGAAAKAGGTYLFVLTCSGPRLQKPDRLIELAAVVQPTHIVVLLVFPRANGTPKTDVPSPSDVASQLGVRRFAPVHVHPSLDTISFPAQLDHLDRQLRDRPDAPGSSSVFNVVR